MNSKKNSFKRVAAGALAVLTVAAYTAPVANVGGLTANLLVADAADEAKLPFDFGGANNYKFITGLTDGVTDLKAGTIESVKPTTADLIVGNSVTFKTTVPFDITAIKNSADYSYTANDPKFDKPNQYYEVAVDVNVTPATPGASVNNYVYDSTKNEYHKIVSKTEIINAELAAMAGYNNLSDTAKTAIAKAAKVVTDGTTGTTVKVDLIGDLKDTKSGGNHTYTFTMPNLAPTVATKTNKLTIKWANTPATTTEPAHVSDNVKKDANDTSLSSSTVTVPEEITTIDDGSKTTASFVAGDTVKITSKTSFKAVIDNDTQGSTDKEPLATIYDKNTKLYVAEFVMRDRDDVSITLEDVVEVYSYKVSGNKLLVSSTSGSLSNDEAAAVNIKYTKDNKEVAVENNSEIENGNAVTISASKVDAFLAAGATAVLEVSKAGTVITAANADANGVTINGDNYTVTKAGKYDITYTITNAGTTYKVTQSFTIAAKTAITAEDVTLTISGKYTKNTYDANGVITASTPNTDIALDTVKGKSKGVSEFNLDKDMSDTHGEFTIVPTISINGVVYPQKNNTGDVNWDVTGYVSGSTLDKDYTFTVKIYDPEFGGSASSPKTFDIKWRANSFGSAPQFKQDAEVVISKDNVSKLSEDIVDAIALNDAATKKADQLTFEYVEGLGAQIGEDELDERTTGLPKTAGSYTVYVSYNDEVKSRVAVDISANALTYTLNSSALNLTYSDKFDITDYVLKDSAGKTVKTVKATDPVFTIKKIQENAKGVLQTDENGDYIFNDNTDWNAVLAADGFLDAGTYLVTISKATSSDPSKYAITGSKQLVKVAKKQLSADLITIMPKNYTGNTYNIVGNAVTAKDPITGVDIKVKITEGSKQSAVGTYKATVALDGTDFIAANAPAPAYYNNNYTGTTEADWHIVAKYALDGGQCNGVGAKYQVGLEWDEERTTLYDNVTGAPRLHLEVNRNANTKVLKGTEKVTVKKFGVVLDKEGKFAAPATYGAPLQTELDAVNAQLLVGNGFTEGGYTESTKDYPASTTTTYKTNITPIDAKTGVWVRSYAIVEDSEKNQMIVYGDTIYLNLEIEAKTQLNLNMPMAKSGDPAVRRADLKDAKPGDSQIKSGYNPVTGKYYVYASFKDLEDAGYTNLLEVSDFGVVVDKKGINAAPANVDQPTLIEKNTVAEKLVVSKDYIVGHYDKTNSFLKVNEYAANITPKDSVTGVWVRPYLDLGNGLIVYGDVQYIKSVSEYFDANVCDAVITPVANSTKLSITVNEPTAPTIKDANNKNLKVTVVKTGVVLDKKGLISDTATPDEIDAALLLNKDFIEGKKTTNADTDDYTAKVTPSTNRLYIRSYVIYEVDGVQFTVYGDAIKYNVSTNQIMAYNLVNGKYIWQN